MMGLGAQEQHISHVAKGMRTFNARPNPVNHVTALVMDMYNRADGFAIAATTPDDCISVIGDI